MERVFGDGRTSSLCRPVFWTAKAMSDVCREFGISRKTGYKIFNRYREEGLEALSRPFAAAGALRQPAAGSRSSG